jgi:hypothetical protein
MILQRNELDLELVSQIIEDINTEAAAAEQTEEDKPPPVKKQFVFMLSDPKGELAGKDYVGWVLQIPEDDSPFTAEERLIRAAYEHNTTRKGRRMPVKTIAEVCEHVPTRVAKEQHIWIKTKEPVYVLRTGGKVPMDEIKKKIKQLNADQADESDGGDDDIGNL